MSLKRITGHSMIAAAMAVNLVTFPWVAEAGSSGTPVIGRILAQVAFRVDNSTATGNATLFEGATVESGTGGPALELASGARLSLGAESRGRVFADHMVLERGHTGLDKADGFRVEARGLRIQPETGNTTGRVHLAGTSRVQVAAVTGSFRVLNAQGVMVARIPSGMALSFEPQVAAGPAKVTGRLSVKGGHYLLTDETTNVTVEVAGPNLAKMVGKRVEVTGSMDPTATPVSDASQYIRVDSVRPLSGTGTAAAGTAGAAGGLSGLAISGTTIAIIGGVAAAAVVGGLAAAGGLSGGTAGQLSR